MFSIVGRHDSGDDCGKSREIIITIGKTESFDDTKGTLETYVERVEELFLDKRYG